MQLCCSNCAWYPAAASVLHIHTSTASRVERRCEIRLVSRRSSMGVLKWDQNSAPWCSFGFKSVLSGTLDTADSFRGPNVLKNYGLSLSKADKLSIHCKKESDQKHLQKK